MAKRIRGNFNPELIQGALRQGDNNVVQMATGAFTAGHSLVYDANGNAIDSGIVPGGGGVPTPPSDATKFLNGAATPAFAQVKDSDLSTSDVTTNNVSIAKHGFAPKLPNDATKFLDGTGAYSAPPGAAASAVVLISELSPSGVGTVTFSAISVAYRDLKVVVRGQSTVAANNTTVLIRFNGDTGANYDQEALIGNGGGTGSTSGVLAGTSILTGWVQGSTAPAGSAGAVDITVYDYRGTTFQKSLLVSALLKANVGATTDLFRAAISGWWRNTAAINSVTVFLTSGNFVAGSVVSLYGLM